MQTSSWRLVMLARRSPQLLLCLVSLHFLLLGSASDLRGQEAGMSAQPSSPSPAIQQRAVPPSGSGQPNQEGKPGMPAAGQPASPSSGQTPMPTQPGTAEGGAPMPKGDGPPAIRTRPAEPPQAPNRDELTALPDDDGRVQFNFQGQAWPDVLEWFAKISQKTLDWQELPGDYLNLTVRRRYTLEEARDLLNRHLLARGFTLLEHGEGFSVVKIENLNPAMVPRIRADELEDHFPHEFVKVLFQLDWLLADDLVKELESLKSPHGKLVALTTTNRLEAMDSVANLRDLHRVLQMEQSREGRHRLVREFSLEHVRASELQEQLETFLGVKRKETAMPANMTPQQMAQMQQQAQMQAQAQAQQAGRAAAPQSKAPEIRLTADNRRNTIIVHAPPDKMAIVESFIELVDVPSGRSDSLDAYLNRMKVYRLASLDPEQFVKSLDELGGLQPSTRVRPDTKNHAILVDASLVDHFTIKSLIDKLDGSGRKFEVVTLRKHAADEMAGSIEFLMGTNQEEKTNSNQQRYYSYNPYGMGMNNANDSTPRDKFRVGANVESNQLLLWANELELQEVEQLLIKLGEIPARRGNSRVRSLDIPLGDNAEAFLRQLQNAWPSIAPNPLLLPQTLPSREQPQLRPGLPSRDPADRPQSSPLHDTRSVPEPVEAGPFSPKPVKTGQDNPFRVAQFTEPFEFPSADPPPVRLGIGPDGNLIISSDDPAALDLMEEWLMKMAPQPKSYEIFRLRHASAFWVKGNLEDFFKEEKSDNSRDAYNSWYRGYSQPSRETDKRQLGKRREIRFIHDYDTNTILVQGADRGQLQVIAELIELYDVPEPATSQSMRMTKLFRIKYSRADVVAETIKDAYRDLLSANDKSLQAQQQQQGQRNGATIIRSYGPQMPGGEEESEKKTQITFKGKLSLGVDEITNTLLVSTEGESLMNTIGHVIEALDTAAREEAHVEVRELSARMSADTLSKTLEKLFEQQRRRENGQPAPQAPPPQPPPQAPVVVSGF